MPAADIFSELEKLKNELSKSEVPIGLRIKAEEMLTRLERFAKSGNVSNEFDSTIRYFSWINSLPWKTRSKDILDINNATKILDKNHHGLNQIKQRILEYIAVLMMKENRASTSYEPEKISRAPILCLVGLAGTGKTTLAYSIAESMGRKFERIPFGGMGDALYLRGQSRVYPDAEPGQIIKALKRASTKNPVILLDEIDRVTDTARATIMGVLVELLDPEQNSAFTDHFIDYPIDLSEVLFVATANNTTNISTAVLDRLEPIQMPSYSDEEKITIARDFVLPKTLEEMGIPKGVITIDEKVWPKIVRPLGFDAGIRTLERTINGIVRKVALMIVEGKGQKFLINEENIRDFLPAW